mmetsp:Transcript_44812/g.74369  ORF Transcript_44812/g.74369 Transcript_44812/m.74369 type:complete len:230 (+) Transcript_44812:35-724(+)
MHGSIHAVRRFGSIQVISLIVLFLGSCASLPLVSDSTRVQVGSLHLNIAEGNADTIDSGARIWDAGRCLASLLGEDEELIGRNVLELGSGTGVGGLSAAAMGADVLLSDQSHMMPLLTENIARNSLAARASATTLIWGDEWDMKHISDRIDSFDLICGSDLLYAPHIFPELLSTLLELSTPGVTQLLLTYPTRHTEGIFFELADEYFEELARQEVDSAIFMSRLRRRAE